MGNSDPAADSIRNGRERFTRHKAGTCSRVRYVAPVGFTRALSRQTGNGKMQVHQDLLDIRALWKIDLERDELRAQAQQLNLDIENAKRQQATLETAFQASSDVQASQSKREREHNRRLDKYLRKRDQTDKLINSGQAMNFAAAQRQLEQCSEIVDEIELELLELMEEQEETNSELSRLTKEIEAAKASLHAARERQTEIRPGLEVRYRELEAARPGRLSSVARHHHTHYKRLRDRHTPVMTNIVIKVCSHCHIEAPPQLIIEVNQSKRPHNCRGCSAWFYEVVEPETDT